MLRSLGICFIALILNPAAAQVDGVSQLKEQVEQQAAAIGNSAVERVYQFRLQVQAEAFSTTLKLCEGYRRAHGMPPTAYHGRHMFTAQQSLAAWGEVYKHGLMQPLTSIVGLKSDYLTEMNRGFFDMETWLGSLYVMYLIDSLGFTQGVMHCFEKIDTAQYNDFMLAVVIADLHGSITTEAATVLAGGEIVKLLVRGTKFVFRPATRILQTLRARVSGKYLLIGSAVVSVPLIYLTADKLLATRKMQALKPGDLITDRTGLSDQSLERYARLQEAFRLLHFVKAERESGSGTTSARDQFVDFLKRNLNPTLRTTYQIDLVQLTAIDEPDRTPKQQAYLALLELLLPLAEKIAL